MSESKAAAVPNDWMTPDGLRNAVMSDPDLSEFVAQWFEDQAKRLESGDGTAVKSGIALLSEEAKRQAMGEEAPPEEEPGFAEGGLVGYDTELAPEDMAPYREWAEGMGRNPEREEEDYDLRGAYKAGFANDGRDHLGDEFKKPNHPTFSDQSRYHGVDGHEGGTWSEENPGGEVGPTHRFTPGPTNRSTMSSEARARYFREREPGVMLDEPEYASGGIVDGPEVPLGALPEEVADDVDAKLSVGELVIPADVLRWHGVKFFEDLRREAKEGFLSMHSDGRMQSPGATAGMPPASETEGIRTPEEPEDPAAFRRGGLVLRFAAGGLVGPQQQPATAAQGFIQATNYDAFGRGTFTGNQGGGNPINYSQPTPAPTPAPNVIMPGVGNTPATPAPAAPAQPDNTGTLAAIGGVAGVIGSGLANPPAQADPLASAGVNQAVKYAGNQLTGAASAPAAGPLAVDPSHYAAPIGPQGDGGFAGGLGDTFDYASSGLYDHAIGPTFGGGYEPGGAIYDYAIGPTADGVGLGASSALDSIGSTVSSWASSLGSSLATAGAGAVGSFIGSKIGDALNGDTQPDPYIQAGATAAGAIAGAYIGSVVPVVGTLIGAAVGALIGSFIGNQPDYPYSWIGSQQIGIDGDKATFNIAGNGGGMNNGAVAPANRLGDALNTYINARAKAEGLEYNAERANQQAFGAGYYKGQLYYKDGEDIAARSSENADYYGNDAQKVGEYAYNSMVNRGFLVAPGSGHMSTAEVRDELKRRAGDPDGDGFTEQMVSASNSGESGEAPYLSRVPSNWSAGRLPTDIGMMKRAEAAAGGNMGTQSLLESAGEWDWNDYLHSQENGPSNG